jgi:hypothetical protein
MHAGSSCRAGLLLLARSCRGRGASPAQIRSTLDRARVSTIYTCAGNPRILEWRAVECPVGQAHKLEYLFCTIGTCNHQDTENVPVWGDAWHSDFFSIIVRNQRIPIIQVRACVRAWVCGWVCGWVDMWSACLT